YVRRESGERDAQQLVVSLLREVVLRRVHAHEAEARAQLNVEAALLPTNAHQHLCNSSAEHCTALNFTGNELN
ncbi:hypothetical protein NL529_27410, partial [Klebsiella pneumoniae]|nr:hypothetical protein [Klebsiella pneumoniae]